MGTVDIVKQSEPLIERRRTLTGFWYWFTTALGVGGVIVAVNQIFILGLGGITLVANSYYYLLLAFYVSIVFLIFPVKKGVSAKRFFWFDAILCFVSLSIFLYFATQALNILWGGWGYGFAPLHMIILSIILWFLLLEAVRRTGNLALLIVISFFSFYPLIAEHMPGLLEGPGRSFTLLGSLHLMTACSVVGVPFRCVADIVFGFLLFGVVLMSTGGGKFFLDLASAILGRSRGGPAKVAVVASSLFGSMSGSVIANVTTTGSFTIPAMKAIGYKPEEAGAIEACASTGGCIMPPVMGAVAFVMAAFIDVPYYTIALAAAIPSILYYAGLFIQIDATAARRGIRGLPESQIPSLKKTLKGGWVYLLPLGVLVYFLFILRLVAQAPFYATALLLVVAMFQKETRFTLKRFLQMIQEAGFFLAEMITMLASVGFILGSLAFTGVAAGFAKELILLAGGNLLLMLILGALASAILGMGLSATACYIFLAIILAPALVMLGFNQLAIHLFVLYWGMVSYITPPVAFGAIPASAIAQCTAGKVGLSAMRFGAIIYFVPFFFVYQPALILQAGVADIIYAFILTLLGVILMASAFQGYLLGFGRMEFGGGVGVRVGTYVLRITLIISGILLGIPPWQNHVLGLAIALVVILAMLLLKNVQRQRK